MVTVLRMATIIGMMTNDILGMVAILGTVWRILTILVRATFLRVVTILIMGTNVGMVTLLEMVVVFRIFIILCDGYHRDSKVDERIYRYLYVSQSVCQSVC